MNNQRSIRPGIRKGMLLILSICLPAAIQFIGLLILKTEPFGTHNLAISDARYYLNNQLLIGRLLKGQENLLYSFNLGIGGNQWGNLAWGGLAPVSLLAAFANLETIPTVFSWISVLNVAFCGLTMYLLLADLSGHRVSLLIFSTSYALMGYNVVNCFQTLFFIGPQMLPLMVLGLLRLMRGQSPLLYILSLAYCIFSNFYFGFMLCVASVVIFLANLYLEFGQWQGRRKWLISVYASASLIAGLIPALMWLPALKAYSGGGRLNQTKLSEFRFQENMPFLQIFSKLFTGAHSTSELVDGLPNIFCGILVVALVILFFLNQRIPARKRRTVGFVLTFYLLSFYVTIFTLIMHGGTHTNWFNYRYSFVFSFLLVGIAAEQFQFLPELTTEEMKRCGIALVAGSILVFSTKYEFVSGAMALLDMALLLIMWLPVYFICVKHNKTLSLKGMSRFLLLVVCVNLLGNYAISIHKMQEWELNLEQYRTNIANVGAAVEGIALYDNSFFRMEKGLSESETVGADPMLYNYNGVSHSGPAERMFVHKELNKLGINWYDMRHWYQDGVPAATDALLGLKYLISKADLEKEKGYEAKTDMGLFRIFRNNSSLSVAILADEPVRGLELNENCFDNLNHIWKSMTGGTKDIFIPESEVTFTMHAVTDSQSITSKELKSSISASVHRSESGETEENPTTTGSYVECCFTAKQDGPVYRFDTSVPASENGQSQPSVTCVGTYQKGDAVTAICEISEDSLTPEQFRGYCGFQHFAYADNAALADYAKQLKERDITFNVEHENDLTGTFTAEKNQRVLFTIPWDEGWTCYIDGQKVPIDKTWDLFMSVEAPEGAHTYEMKFFPAWMNIGIGISCGALLGLVMLMVLWKRSSKESSNAEQNKL